MSRIYVTNVITSGWPRDAHCIKFSSSFNSKCAVSSLLFQSLEDNSVKPVLWEVSDVPDMQSMRSSPAGGTHATENRVFFVSIHPSRCLHAEVQATPSVTLSITNLECNGFGTRITLCGRNIISGQTCKLRKQEWKEEWIKRRNK
jgi:hypothetical protein